MQHASRPAALAIAVLAVWLSAPHVGARHRGSDHGINSCDLPDDEQPYVTLGLPRYQRHHIRLNDLMELCLVKQERIMQDYKLQCERWGWHYSHAMAHEFVLPAVNVERSVGNMGDRRALQAFMRKLLAGEAVRVVGIGASITEGGGVMNNKDRSFLSLFFAWISSTFPHAKHDLVNAAIGGITSFYYADCMLVEFVTPGTDLVLVDFLLNDKMGIAPGLQRLSYEAMFRTILSMPDPPAVLALQLFSWFVSEGGFLDTYEDSLAPVLKYYSVPSLSMRNALWREYEADKPGFQYNETWCDVVHPSRLGHAYIADMIIGLMQDLLFKELVSEIALLPPDTEPLPPEMAGDELVHVISRSCLRDDALRAAVLPSVEGVAGWDWTDEGRGKWGFVGEAAGQVLEAELSTECVGTPSEAKVSLGVGMLKSYQHMGMANVECVSGCECEQRLMDGMWAHHSSQSHIEAAIVTQAPRCRVRLTVSDMTRSDMHKFKLTALSLRCSDQPLNVGNQKYLG